MLQVVPLLADSRVEQDHFVGDKVDHLFIDEFGLFIKGALSTYALRSHAANSVLEGPPHITCADAIHPFQLDLLVIRCPQVIVHRLVLKSVGYYRLESRVQPGSEVQSSSVLSQLGG